MATTIALKDDTYFLLKMMKQELETVTYDETITKMNQEPPVTALDSL